MKLAKYSFPAMAALLGALTTPVFADKNASSNIISFDATGADITPNDYNGTFPTSINSEGVIAGYYVSASNVYHGFLRLPNGKFVTVDAPGADTTAGSYNGTLINGINDFGEATGYYFDANGAAHGFLRSAAARYTSFDVPGSAGYSNAVAINLEGSVVGYYLDANSQFHAFLRKPDAMFVSFDGPSGCQSGTPSGCYGSAAFNINIFGMVAANYADDSGNFVNIGLNRSRSGKLTTYEAPGAGTGGAQGTGCPGCSIGLNNLGAIAGIYTDSNSVYHGFVRSPDGRFTTFDAPAAGSSSYQGTGCAADCSVSLNDRGEITGVYSDANGTYHGFFRYSNGQIQSYDPSNSLATVPAAINAFGAAVGYYVDAKNVYHGFLRLPSPHL